MLPNLKVLQGLQNSTSTFSETSNVLIKMQIDVANGYDSLSINAFAGEAWNSADLNLQFKIYNEAGDLVGTGGYLDLFAGGVFYIEAPAGNYTFTSGNMAHAGDNEVLASHTFTTISNAVVAVTVDDLIQQSLDSVKTYVDTQDASVKTYVDSKVDALMQTTDLTAKLQLLNEINAILDGDTATAGFQLWESNVAKLNQIITDFEANKTTVAQQINAASSFASQQRSLLANDLQALTIYTNDNVARIDASISAHFLTLKAKAAIIFAV